LGALREPVGDELKPLDGIPVFEAEAVVHRDTKRRTLPQPVLVTLGEMADGGLEHLQLIRCQPARTRQ